MCVSVCVFVPERERERVRADVMYAGLDADLFAQMVRLSHTHSPPPPFPLSFSLSLSLSFSLACSLSIKHQQTQLYAAVCVCACVCEREREVDIRLPGKGDSTPMAQGRPTETKWIWTSRLSIKNSLSEQVRHGALDSGELKSLQVMKRERASEGEIVSSFPDSSVQESERVCSVGRRLF